MFYRTFTVFICLKGDLSQALFDTLFLGMYTYVVFNFIYDHETCRRLPYFPANKNKRNVFVSVSYIRDYLTFTIICYCSLLFICKNTKNEQVKYKNNVFDWAKYFY